MNGIGLSIDCIPENGSKGFTYHGRKLFAVKKKNNIYVYHNSCPHVAVPLDWDADQFLDSSNSMIQCANHGALFVIENGYCVSGPCHGKKLTAVAFDIVEGVIYPH